jgi:4,5-DOPA dioxygenase extradiol
MNRKRFLRSLALLPISGLAMNLNKLKLFTDPLQSTETMPVLFVGHGSPMNAIEDNEFTRGWHTVSSSLPRPSAILCISAHWETKGTLVTAMEMPPTIHDFGGFPQALFDVEYPAPGSPELAEETRKMLVSTNVNLDHNWGLDHGAWSVVKRFYPNADIPVIQLSLDYYREAGYHYDLARDLQALRNKGVLIMGSGNMVHNLRMLDWNRADSGYDWALEANDVFKNLIRLNDHRKLADYKKLGTAVQMAVPTPEHFLPLLYALALKTEKDEVTFFNDKPVMGSLTMTSLRIG